MPSSLPRPTATSASPSPEMARRGGRSPWPTPGRALPQKRPRKSSISFIRWRTRAHRDLRGPGWAWRFRKCWWRCSAAGSGSKVSSAVGVRSLLPCQCCHRSRPQGPRTRRGRMGLKVLIADDEDGLVDVLRDRLEAYGFTVLTAGTGREAVERLATEPVDGIFLDVQMPDLDRLAALEQIRRRDSQTPILIVPASSDHNAAADALARGANAYVLKPFEWDELKATIEQLYHITLER